MFDLIRHIERGLAVKDECPVFFPLLDATWPVRDGSRESQRTFVRAFADEQGWQVEFPPGARWVIFRPFHASSSRTMPALSSR